MRGVHAQRMGLARHHPRETVFVAADVFGDRDGDVVGGFRDHGLDRVFDLDRLARLQAELRGGLRGGVLRDHQRRVETQVTLFKLFEQKIEGHHLGDGGGVPRLILIRREQRAPAVAVDDDGGHAARGRHPAAGGLGPRIMMTSMAALIGLTRAAMMMVRDVNGYGAPMIVRMPSMMAPSRLGSGR